MVKVKLWLIIEMRNKKIFIGEKIYYIPYIIRKAHIVPAIVAPI